MTAAKNRLERKRLRREEAEIDDFHVDREKRLRKEDEEQQRRYEEQWEADQRQRDKAAAIERRQKFISTWTEYGLRQKPYDAPTEVELDIHEQVLAALAKVDVNDRDYVVRRLVDAAVERGLRTWNTEKAKQGALQAVLGQLPYDMRWDETWKRRATKTASAALTDVLPGGLQKRLRQR